MTIRGIKSGVLNGILLMGVIHVSLSLSGGIWKITVTIRGNQEYHCHYQGYLIKNVTVTIRGIKSGLSLSLSGVLNREYHCHYQGYLIGNITVTIRGNLENQCHYQGY